MKSRRTIMRTVNAVIAFFAVVCFMGYAAESFAQAKKQGPAQKAPAAKAKGKQDKAPAGKEGETEEDLKSRRPAEIERDKPQIGREVSRDVAADQERDKAIATLTEIIRTLKGRPPQKADMMFQLSELYWEKAKFLYFKEMDDYNAKVEACFKQTNNPERCGKIKINNSQSRSYQNQALVIYERILREFPDYPRKDEVLFVLGYNKYESGKKVEGVRHWWDLTKQYPKSRFASDAYLQLGEHFFNTNDVFKAVQAYRKALEYNDPKTYIFALYKLAWCDFNLGEYDRAIAKFKEVVTISIREQQRSQQAAATGAGADAEKGKIRLRREALNDMVLAYTMIDAVNEARDYFMTVADRKETHDLVERLGNTYETQGKDELVIETFRMLVDEDQDHPKCPSYQNSIVQAYARMGNKARVMDEMRRLIDNYRPASVWAQKNAENKWALDQAYDITETTLREMVTTYHEQAQKTKDFKTYGLARDIYREYLENFPTSESAYRMRFFYSEILFLMEDFIEAARQYDLVVQTNKEGEFSKIAAYASVLCWEKLVDNDCQNPRSQIELAAKGGKLEAKKGKEQLKRFRLNEREMVIEKGKSYEKIAMNECTQKLVSASDAFTAVVDDKNPNFLPVKFKIAFIYYKHNDFEESARRLGEIIKNYPKDPLARRSALIVLDAFSNREDWKNLFLYSSQFRENKELVANDKKFSGELDRLMQGSAFYIIMGTYAEAQKLEEEKKEKEAEEKYALCATEFTKYVDSYPESRFSEKALYNAVVIYDKANKLDLALKNGMALYDRFDSRPVKDRLKKADKAERTEHDGLLENLHWYIATFYERVTDFRNSEIWYQRYLDKYASLKTYRNKPQAIKKDMGEEKAGKISDALFNIALFSEKLGNTKKAIDYYEDYIRYFPDKEDVAEVYYNIGLIYERRNEWAKSKKHFEEFTKRFKPAEYKAGRHIEALQRVKEAALKLKMKPQDIVEINKQIVKAYEATPDANKTLISKLYAVGSMFELLQPKFDQYKAIKLSIKVSQLKKDLENKAKMLQELQEDYVKILQTGQGDWGLAALFQIGRLYEEFAETLFEAPVPRYLTEDQKMIYKGELESRAFPLEEKAIEAYEFVLTKASELSIYNEWTVLAQDRLRKYRPDAYPVVPEPEFVLSTERYVPPEGAVAPTEKATSLQEAEEELRTRSQQGAAASPPPVEAAQPAAEPEAAPAPGGEEGEDPYGGEDIPSLDW